MCERGTLSLEKAPVGDGLGPVQINRKAHPTSAGTGHNQFFSKEQSQSLGVI